MIHAFHVFAGELVGQAVLPAIMAAVCWLAGRHGA